MPTFVNLLGTLQQDSRRALLVAGYARFNLAASDFTSWRTKIEATVSAAARLLNSLQIGHKLRYSTSTTQAFKRGPNPDSKPETLIWQLKESSHTLCIKNWDINVYNPHLYTSKQISVLLEFKGQLSCFFGGQWIV